MNVNRFKIFCVEIYKTINKLNLEFINNIFKVKDNKTLVRQQYKLIFETRELNQVTFGAKSLKIHRPKIWNSLFFISNHLKIYLYCNFSLHKINYSLVLFFYYKFYKILHRCIVLYINFAVPSEKYHFC